LQILAELSADDVAARIESNRATEWLYVFRPEVAASVPRFEMERRIMADEIKL